MAQPKKAATRSSARKKSRARKTTTARKTSAPKKAAEPFWDPSAITSIQDLQRDSLGPSRREALKRQYEN